MLRRTKNTILNGQPLLDLPARTVTIVECQFSTEEREFYNGVQVLVDKGLEKLQTSDANNFSAYTSMLVLLLRLRQGKLSDLWLYVWHLVIVAAACNHPSLVSKDYHEDKEAVQPKAAKNDDDVNDDGDDLAQLMGDLGIAGAIKRCKMCQSLYISATMSWE